MRIFYVHPGGQYEGEHTIYESREEFRKHEPNAVMHRWGRDDYLKYERYDWVESTDGYIVQILSKRYLTCGKYVRYLFRFPMGTFVCYDRANGTKRYSKFYVSYQSLDNSSISGRYRGNNYDKIKFAKLIVCGVPLGNALLACNSKPIRFNTTRQLIGKALKLMEDPTVKAEIQNQLVPFIKKLRDADKFSDEVMVQYVEDFMQHVRKGSMVHLQSIVPLLKLTGKISEDFMDKPKVSSKKDDAEEIPYQELPPPV